MGAGLAQVKKEACCIDRDVVQQISQSNRLPCTLGHPHHLAAADKPHKLHQDNVQPVGVDPNRLQRALHAGDVAVVIRAPDIDGLIVATLYQFVAMVGDVGGEIGRVAVGTHEHLILFGAAFGCFIPKRAVFS